jgi:membrane protein YqaA with SNARE-associated domain
MSNRSRALLALALLVVAVAIMSLTIGKAIVYDRQPGLTSFGVIHFLGYLFFLLMPVEALVPYYLAEGQPGTILIIIAVLTALAAQVIDYAIGYAVSGEVIDSLVGPRRYRRAQRAIERFGPAAVVFFNLLPLSSPNLLLVAGMARFSFRKAIMFSAIGLVSKYVAIVYLSWGFFWGWGG